MSHRYAIVTPVKDEEEFLPNTIESILRQAIKPQIWVLINDNSSDRTGGIIEELKSKINKNGSN